MAAVEAATGLHSLSLPADLTAVFYQTANFTEDYDTGDYDGDGPPYYFPSDYNSQWHLPNLVDRAGGISTAEVTIIGDDLMPYAIRRTAELYRLFYKTVDTTAPICTMIYPSSEDQNHPDYRTSTAAFNLIADGNDLQSGVVKDKLSFSLCRMDRTGVVGVDRYYAVSDNCFCELSAAF